MQLNPIEKTIRTALERGDADDRAFREKVYRSVFAALEKNIAANPDLTDDAVDHRREMLKASIRTIEQEFVPAFEPEEPVEAEALDLGDLDDLDEIPEPAQPVGPRASFERTYEERYEEQPAPYPSIDPFPKAPSRGGDQPSSWAAASNRYYGGEPPAAPPPRGSRPPASSSTGQRAPVVAARPVARPAPRESYVIEPEPRQPFDDETIPLPEIEPRRAPQDLGRRVAAPGLDGLVPRRDERKGQRRSERGRSSPYDGLLRGEAERPRRRGRFFIILFLAATLFAAGAMAVWWTIDSGLFLSRAERDTSVPNPPLKLEDEEFQPDGPPPLSDQQAIDREGNDWITIFTPTDPTRVLTLSGGTAQVIEIEGGMALRIRSSAPGEPVRFEVGQGILQTVAGRSAVFNIRARTEPGQETEILVTCDFGPLGDCGRKRYVVSSENRDFAVGLDLPDVAPKGAGSIAIVTDFGDGGRSVDIIEISVSVPE